MSATQPEDDSTRMLFRRVWGKKGQGSSQIALKAMGALYDAGVPLTGHEIADRVVSVLDPYERSYLEAWYLRRMKTASLSNIHVAMRRWLNDHFYGRTKGGTLIRDPDRRFRPGHTAPKMLTNDGRLMPFTPAARSQVAQDEHDNGRLHLAKIEGDRVKAKFDLTTPAKRMHFKALATRLVGEPSEFDARSVRHDFAQLRRLIDTDGVRRGFLQWLEES